MDAKEIMMMHSSCSQYGRMILESKFERFRGNERADRKIEEILEAHDDAVEEENVMKES